MAGQNQQQQNKEPQAANPMEALAAMGLSTGQGGTATIAEYFKLMLEREKERDRIKQLAQEQEARVRKEGAEAAERERRHMVAKQKHCSHKSEDGKPKTGGVRSLNGIMGVTCGICRKSWEGTEPELRAELGFIFPRAEQITGPIQH